MADDAVTRWHIRNPQRLQELEHQLLSRHPGLRFDVTAERVVVTGTFQIVDGKRVVDEFRVAIELPANFPYELPVVRELGSRIPLHEDFHANADGTLCVVLPHEYWFARSHCELVEYLDGPLRNYFIGLLHFQDVGSWPFGEHLHGGDGVLAFYSKVFGSSRRVVVEAYLSVLAEGRPRPRTPCPCGSRKPIKKCHWLKVFKLHREIRSAMAKAALDRI